MDSIFDINVNKFNIRLSAGHNKKKKILPKNFRFLTVFLSTSLLGASRSYFFPSPPPSPPNPP